MEAQVAYTTLGSSPAISIVPTEILEKIFMSYFEQEVGQYDEKMLHSPAQFDVPTRLGAVCARWRQIVHGMSRLWSFISVKNHEDSMTMGVKRLLELYLERSGVQPLRIAVTNLIEPPHSGIRPSMDSLSPLCDIPLDRVHHLTLKEPIGGDGNIKVSGNSMPNLHHLTSLDLIGSYKHRVVLNFPIGLSFPELRSVRLQWCVVFGRIFDQNNRVESLHLSYIFFIGPKPYTFQFPHLRTLHLTQNEQTITGSILPIEIQLGSPKSSITQLILEDAHPQSLEWINKNDFSSLTHLSIRSDDFLSVDHLLNFVQTIGPKITHLDLKNLLWRRMPWSAFFTNFEALQYLRIRGTVITSFTKIMPLFMALPQSLSTSQKTLQYLSHIEIIAPNDLPPLDATPIHQFVESRHRRGIETGILTTPNAFKQEDIESLARICTFHVIEWDFGSSGRW